MDKAQTFEQAHPDTAAIIEERGYETTRYERYYDGKLKEVWEKRDGEWQDVTSEEVKQSRQARELSKVEAELESLRAYLRAHGVDPDAEGV